MSELKNLTLIIPAKYEAETLPIFLQEIKNIGAKIKIVSGANKDTNAIKLDDSQDNVYDPNKEGETRRINNTTGYFGTQIS